MKNRNAFVKTHDDQSHHSKRSKQRKIHYECWAVEQCQKILQRASRLRHNSEDSNENGTACDAESADDHPRREDIA